MLTCGYVCVSVRVCVCVCVCVCVSVCTRDCRTKECSRYSLLVRLLDRHRDDDHVDTDLFQVCSECDCECECVSVGGSFCSCVSEVVGQNCSNE